MTKLAIRPSHNLLGATLYLGATLGAGLCVAKWFDDRAKVGGTRGSFR